jgi:hypothetical protein
LILHGSLAIFGQVEKNLHQALAVGPYGRQVFLYLPLAGNAVIAQRGFHNDAQFVEQGLHLDAGSMGGSLPQIHAGDALKGKHQRTQGLKVFIFFELPAAGQIFMDQSDGSADVAYLM